MDNITENLRNAGTSFKLFCYDYNRWRCRLEIKVHTMSINEKIYFFSFSHPLHPAAETILVNTIYCILGGKAKRN